VLAMGRQFFCVFAPALRESNGLLLLPALLFVA
jgi:hypothetical protein